MDSFYVDYVEQVVCKGEARDFQSFFDERGRCPVDDLNVTEINDLQSRLILASGTEDLVNKGFRLR